MHIRNQHVKISAIAVAVAAFFAVFLIFNYLVTGEVTIFFWGVPLLAMLIVIPAVLNYLSQREYADLVPEYEREAKNVRIRMINESMIGRVVRIEGVVEQVHFQFLNRPQYLVADRSGEISVKMFTNPAEDVKVNDVVEVLGSVIRRYVAAGDPVINCISIKKIDKPAPPQKKK